VGRYPGAPWTHTTCVNRFNRWRKAGVWARVSEAVSKAYDGDIQMIDSSSIRVHQHATNAQKKTDPVAWVARVAA
jgi:transposase